VSILVLDAEALYAELRRGVQALRAGNEARLVGITSGGAWLAARLQEDLGLRAQRA
jgi:pyrimidine operon attenuation protein/uracil phosphoribosyltransferase